MKRKIAIFIAFIILPFNVFAYSSKIIPGGETIGINVSSKGVLVVGFYKVNGKYNKGEPSLKEGDYILEINGNKINVIDDFLNIINNQSGEEKLDITFSRNNVKKHTLLDLINVNGELKTGLYIKDNITGIGTLSYIDPETKVYGALGHEIEESNSKVRVDIDGGNIFRNYITSIDRSVNGKPGSKNAKFYENDVYGDIKKNSKYGIYGSYDKNSNKDALEIKKLNDINLGKAYIRTVTKGEEVNDYEIEIISINKNDKYKSISFKVTDERLLKESGGIVQGMSGSPIIQDNYLVGAVTHVLIDDVTSGYGVSIITMLDEGDKLVD